MLKTNGESAVPWWQSHDLSSLLLLSLSSQEEKAGATLSVKIGQRSARKHSHPEPSGAFIPRWVCCAQSGDERALTS